jgi:transposase
VDFWVHTHRKFKEVTKAVGNKRNSSGNAGIALKDISKLYKIEKEARLEELSLDQLYAQRQSLPILDELKKWFDARMAQVPLKSLLGKVINYTLNEWHRLTRYTQDGRIKPDNNTVENAIRLFVVGRKNWLLSCSSKGAYDSAAIYSLIETDKANGLDLY